MEDRRVEVTERFRRAADLPLTRFGHSANFVLAEGALHIHGTCVPEMEVPMELTIY